MNEGTKVVEKKVYEEGKKHDYASKLTGNAGLTLGIIGTALGAGAWLWGNGGRGTGLLGGGAAMPENVITNILFGSKKTLVFGADDLLKLKDAIVDG